MDEPLLGGVANSGSVFRRGDVVVRHRVNISKVFTLTFAPFEKDRFIGALNPRALAGNQEEFDYIEGDVAIPPYPSWAPSTWVATNGRWPTTPCRRPTRMDSMLPNIWGLSTDLTIPFVGLKPSCECGSNEVSQTSLPFGNPSVATSGS
jgi:hypothetical protein